MERINELCDRYHIDLCYLFGSQQAAGKVALEGETVTLSDPESDADVAVLFRTAPENPTETYARLSADLQELLSPLTVDPLFLHETDHLIQLEAIRGLNVYARDAALRESYEDHVRAMAADEIEIFKRNERDLLEAIKNGYFEFEYSCLKTGSGSSSKPSPG